MSECREEGKLDTGGPTIAVKLPEVLTTKSLLEQTEETHWMGTFGTSF